MKIKNQKDLEKFVMEKLEPPVDVNAQTDALNTTLKRAKAINSQFLNRRITEMRR